MKPLFFVHIPKTAGTSFRIAAQKYFGFKNVACDYGTKADETSDLVQEYVYRDNDIFGLYRSLHENGVKMIGGHIPAAKYLGVSGVGNLVTFLRDPIQRLYSEYQHFVRLKDYKGTFREFYSRPIKINQLSKNLEKVKSEAVGVLGLTELYPESLSIINHVFGTKFKALEENMGRDSVAHNHSIEPEDLDELVRLNLKDVKLYEHAKSLFEQRYRLLEAELPYAHCRLVEVSASRVSGWAFWEGGNDAPVEIEIRVNGVAVKSTVATNFRPALCHWMPPRQSYIGFSGGVSAKDGDSIDCCVKTTGQRFPPNPIVIGSKK